MTRRGAIWGGALVVALPVLGISWREDSALPLVLLAGICLGAGAVWLAERGGSKGFAARGRRANREQRAERLHLVSVLTQMGDLLRQVSPEQLGERGGWDQDEFGRVLRQVEQLTPAFQQTLSEVLSDGPLARETLDALLDVDRLSAAYTYWTRLFPPRRGGESMFVLSLLHDLGDKVEHALILLAG